MVRTTLDRVVSGAERRTSCHERPNAGGTAPLGRGKHFEAAGHDAVELAESSFELVVTAGSVERAGVGSRSGSNSWRRQRSRLTARVCFGSVGASPDVTPRLDR